MIRSVPSGYFYSLEPYWGSLAPEAVRMSPQGDFILLRANHRDQWINCIPGNGIIGLILKCSPSGVTGTCYGILKDPRPILVEGVAAPEERVYILRFATGAFSKICRVPLYRLDPDGLDIRYIFSGRQMAALQDVILHENTADALFDLFCSWLNAGVSRLDPGRMITNEVIFRIWEQRGNIRIRDLEEITLYSSRYLEKLLINNVGMTPKQLCNHMRFQHAINLLKSNADIRQAELALLLGYSDQAHFCKVFRRLSGHTPVEFMTLHREGMSL